LIFYNVGGRQLPKYCKSPEYYGEGTRKLNLLDTRQTHQCSSLNSDLISINITNESKFEDLINYIVEWFES
jgi:hypothetical protein